MGAGMGLSTANDTHTQATLNYGLLDLSPQTSLQAHLPSTPYHCCRGEE